MAISRQKEGSIDMKLFTYFAEKFGDRTQDECVCDNISTEMSVL